MTRRITAVVEQGRLRPTTPLDIPEGTEVEVTIQSVAGQPPYWAGPKLRRGSANLA